MEHMSSVLSLLFFLGALISLFWGFYIIRLNIKSNINRAFLLLCISLSIWSFGFGMANLVISLDRALFWRRFASIGMTSIFSIILHFLFLLTYERKDSKTNKKIFLLHIPAFICMYIFVFSSNMAMLQYSLVKGEYGLTNMASNSIWNYFYYSYYTLYMGYGLILVWKWKKRLEDKMKIRQANFIIASILVSLVFASLTDIVASSFFTASLPQMAPLFVLLPVWSMYYSARHYDLIDDKESNKEELIVTEKEKEKIFNNISRVFIISGLLSFILEYNVSTGNIKDSFGVGTSEGVIFLAIGAVLYFVQRLRNNFLKDTINIAILVGSIPLITLQFLDYAGTTVWAFPIIIVLASLVLSKKKLLFLTGLASIITQILIWILNPEQTVVIEKNDYIFRIIIILTAIVVGYYVNRIYIAKILENDFRIKFQEMNAKVSSEFLTVNKENIDRKINKLLSEMGLFFRADRTYLFLIDHENNTMTYSYEWCNKGVEVQLGSIENIKLTRFPWLIEGLKNKKLLSIEDTRKMPKEAIREQDEFLRRSIKSLVTVPVEGEEGIKGFLGVDSVTSYREWPKKDISLLNVLANLLSDALIKLESEKEIEYMAYYDGLTDLPNRFLFAELQL